MREYYKIGTKVIDGEELSLGIAMVSYKRGGMQEFSLAVYNEWAVLDSMRFRRSRAKEAEAYLKDCALNFTKDEVKNANEKITGFLENPTIRYNFKTQPSNPEIWKSLCDYVKKYEVPYITDYDKKGRVRIEKEKFKAVVEEIVGHTYHKETIAFLLESGYLKTGPDRDTVFVNKSETCPRGYRAYVFDDYYKVVEREAA